MARKTIDGLNPEMVLGLTATPKAEMNVLVTITGLELKEEDMVKLDMHIIPPSGRKEDDWKSMLREIKAHRDTLEKKANKYRQNTGLYIRPIALLQVERTGKEQRGKGFVHSHDVKDFLQDMEIHPDEIAIKSSSQNDIEDVNLFAQDCNIRYIITKEALREGWDCSFAYMLGIIPNVNLKSSFSEETKERRSIIVTLDAESKVVAKYEHSEVNGTKEINIDYLTRRYAELTENPFYARKMAYSHTETLIKEIGKERVAENFGYISAFLYKILSEVKTMGEESLFLDYLKSRKIVLAVGNNKDVGFKIPDEDNITVGCLPNPYKYYLFEDVDLTSMNRLEQKVGDILDKQEKILWWFRNKVSGNWYSIQGWQEYKLRPDFVAAKKSKKGELELVYILESKGEHLSGNVDTIYKQKVLNVMTEQKKQKAIYRFKQMSLPFGQVNDSVEFYLVEQGKEEEDLKKFFK